MPSLSAAFFAAAAAAAEDAEMYAALTNAAQVTADAEAVIAALQVTVAAEAANVAPQTPPPRNVTTCPPMNRNRNWNIPYETPEDVNNSSEEAPGFSVFNNTNNTNQQRLNPVRRNLFGNNN